MNRLSALCCATLMTLAGCAAATRTASTTPPSAPDVDLLYLQADTAYKASTMVRNFNRIYDPATGVWTQGTDQTGPYHERKELIAACEDYLKRTNRGDSKLSGYTSHARLWIFIYGPADADTVGGGITLFVDSKTAKVVAQTVTY